ncbi:MAG: DsbA family protein [Halanaeroarchaeum sp.]
MTRTRRAVLRGGGLALLGGVAGCLSTSGGTTESTTGGAPTSADRVQSLPTPTLGPADAPVTVAVYEDYACPHCRTYATTVFPKIRSTYVESGVVRYEHHDFPIPVHDRWSWAAPNAARRVQDSLGDAAFFSLSQALYRHFDSYSLDTFGTLAADVGADPTAVRRAAAKRLYRPVILADRRAGRNRGVTGTPTVFVNGTPTANYAWDTVRAAIEDARP